MQSLCGFTGLSGTGVSFYSVPGTGELWEGNLLPWCIFTEYWCTMYLSRFFISTCLPYIMITFTVGSWHKCIIHINSFLFHFMSCSFPASAPFNSWSLLQNLYFHFFPSILFFHSVSLSSSHFLCLLFPCSFEQDPSTDYLFCILLFIYRPTFIKSLI